VSQPDTFFEPRAQRSGHDWVLSELPFPVALTYLRLHQQMDRQEPVASAWTLRDAYECALKFSACLAVSDCLGASPDPALASELVPVLLDPRGLSLGHWHTLLEGALKPLGELAHEGQLGASSRRVPELFEVFFDASGARTQSTEVNARINQGGGSFVAWRNRVFGHGVFVNDRQWYADQTLEWLPRLHAFYDALGPVLSRWRLVALTPGGGQVDWQGVADLPPVPAHEHAPSGQALPMHLVSRQDSSAPGLCLSPLLSIQRCVSCDLPAAFFFDKHQIRQKGDSHRTHCLEYYARAEANRETRSARSWPAAVSPSAPTGPAARWPEAGARDRTGLRS
jgi:hypothetical protein